MNTTNHRPRYGGPALAAFAVLVGLCLLVMVGAGSGSGKAGGQGPTADKWTCSMCPQFILPESGKCPKCFMDLIPLSEGAYGGGRRELILSREAADLAGIASELAETGPDGRTLLIPGSALLRNLGRSFVFTETDEGEELSFILREIETDGVRDGMVAVTSGLDAGDAVAASGLFRLDSALQILGKVSLTNLPEGDLDDVDNPAVFQPADRSEVDLRREGGPPLDSWFELYEEVRADLARDDFAASATPAAGLARALNGAAADLPEEDGELWGNLRRDAGELSAATDIFRRRAAFDRLSADMVLLARRYGAAPGGLRLVFCPMAFGGRGAHWLQPGETVDNPFHGLEMPLCGWEVEVIGDFAGGRP